MAFNFYDLSLDTRKLMEQEILSDAGSNRLYKSKRFNDNGNAQYHDLLLDAVRNGNEDSLATNLKNHDCFLEYEPSTGKKVPKNANEVLAQGEFNRYYMRALALQAITRKITLKVYRARVSSNPRPESEALIGKEFNPVELLEALRRDIGSDVALGLPPGPTSGLTVMFKE